MPVDIFGREIQIGQIIAYGVSSQKVGQLRVGIVTKINEKGMVFALGFRKDYFSHYKLELMDKPSPNISPDKIVTGIHIPIEHQKILETNFHRITKGKYL